MFARKPTAILSEMPWNVKKLIVENAEKSVLSSLRNASSEFRAYIPAPTLFCNALVLRFIVKGRKVQIEFFGSVKWRSVVFSPALNGSTLRTSLRLGKDEKKELIENSNHILEAITCLQSLLRMSGLNIKDLDLRVNSEGFVINEERLREKSLFLRELKNCLESFPRKLKVFQFNCFAADSVEALSVLPYLDEHELKRFNNEPPLNHATNNALSVDILWNIPEVYIPEVPVDQLTVFLQHVRRLPTFESFFTSWRSEHMYIHPESFMEEAVWSLDQDGGKTTTIATEDPNFVLRLLIDREPSRQIFFLRRERVHPEP